MPIPAGMDQHRLPVHVDLTECVFSDFSAVSASHNDAVEICHLIQIETRKILATRVAMKRAVEIRPRISHHLDLADVKLSAGRVTAARLFTTEMIADHGRG